MQSAVYLPTTIKYPKKKKNPQFSLLVTVYVKGKEQDPYDIIK